MKNLVKVAALSAILGGTVLATTPAQAWWGPWGGNGWGPWGSDSRNWMDDWMDGTGWGDMNFNSSVGGRGYGRGRSYDRYYDGWGYPGYWGGYPGAWGGYPYGGYGAPYGGYYGTAPYGAPAAPQGQQAPAKK